MAPLPRRRVCAFLALCAPAAKELFLSSSARMADAFSTFAVAPMACTLIAPPTFLVARAPRAGSSPRARALRLMPLAPSLRCGVSLMGGRSRLAFARRGAHRWARRHRAAPGARSRRARLRAIALPCVAPPRASPPRSSRAAAASRLASPVAAPIHQLDGCRPRTMTGASYAARARPLGLPTPLLFSPSLRRLAR